MSILLPGVAYASGLYEASSVAIADVNDDQKPDLSSGFICVLAPSCLTGSVSVLMGDGEGTLLPAAADSPGRR